MDLKDFLLSRPQLAKLIGISMPTLDLALKGQYSEKTKKLILAFVRARILEQQRYLDSLENNDGKN